MKFFPSCDQILKLAPDYDMIPVSREIFADIITPITLLRKLSERSRRFFLLESVEGGETWGRYSFLGFDPIMRVTCKDKKVTVTETGTDTAAGSKPEFQIIKTEKPFDVLRGILKKYRAPLIDGLPPFTGGFTGYFAYPMIGYAEPKLTISKDSCNDFDLMLFDQIIAYDHLKQKISIVVNIRTDRVMENYGTACARIEAIASMIQDSSPLPKSINRYQPEFKCNLSKGEFLRIVEQTKESIAEGEIFQAVISRQFESPYQGSLINAYRLLRTTNPSPYMVYLSIDGDEIISASPETLVRLKDNRLTTFPVAGSRPRGATKKEDEYLEEELLSDEKELAEHNMLVDLGRNDIGKISRFSTVEVTKYKMIHKYSKIMHICSQVEGEIQEHYDALSAIEALLPAGTLSGAPKFRACQIIEELEQTPRGIYGGALGYIDFTGNMDTCIAIRMAVKMDGTVKVQAGGGIVADSVPEREYEESASKASAVIQAIIQTGEVND